MSFFGCMAGVTSKRVNDGNEGAPVKRKKASCMLRMLYILEMLAIPLQKTDRTLANHTLGLWL